MGSKPLPHLEQKQQQQQQQQQEVLLGRYELGRLLGRGTFAKVYFARALSDGSPVAVKVLDKQATVRSGVGPMILREVSAMRRLSPHPNILRLHEVMATKSRIYLVMEHARGGELFARLARHGRLPEPAARRYFQQLLSALRFCHAHGIAHRDIKPENLLLDRDGNLKLSDFGLSALPDQLRASGDGLLHTACGTPAYTAPEVIRRKGYDGAKADAWSCGIFLYVLLAGFLPFDDSNIALMYRKTQKRDYRFPPWFSPSAKRVIAGLLDPDPATRTSVDGLMESPWIRRCYSFDPQLNLLSHLPPPAGEGDGAQFTTALPAPALSESSFPLSMNAFDIISMSSGLDLSGLFDEQARKRERRFTSTAGVERILERVEEVGAKLGYAMEKRKGGGGVVGRGKWGTVLSVEVSEVAPPILLVELRIDGGGDNNDNGKDDDGGGDRLSWGVIRAELGDVVSDWHKISGGGE